MDLTYAVAKFLVEQARGNTHAPASPREENSLLIYNYQTTFTGKVSLVRRPQLRDSLPACWVGPLLRLQLSAPATWLHDMASLKLSP